MMTQEAIPIPIKKKLYGMVIGIPQQEEIMSNHCFKTCGKIIIGVVMDKELGALAICREPKENCPQLDKQMDEPMGEVQGELLYLRKLK